MPSLFRFLIVAVFLIGLTCWPERIGFAQTQPGRPTFRTSVDLVSVTAVVRDERGRSVRNLSRDDFQLFEQGRPRPIKDFRVSDQGPISVAILMDASGSMRVGAQLEASQRAVEHLLSWVEPQRDEISLFSFDKDLRQEVPFTTDVGRVRAALYRIEALGLTSLYDAIGKTARTLAARPSPRRAVIVITDGIDTSSELSPSDVSGLASGIDVPVYVIAVLSPLDHAGTEYAVPSAAGSPVSTHLTNLAYWTGGDLVMTSAPAHASAAARSIITELRHQYLLSFEAARRPGWYPLEVKTRRRDLTVRARSGYFAGDAVPTASAPSTGLNTGRPPVGASQ
jgi:Ca-activated chloride channel family protein